MIQPPRFVLFSLSPLFPTVTSMPSMISSDGNINVFLVKTISSSKTKRPVQQSPLMPTVMLMTPLPIPLPVLDVSKPNC